MRYLIPVVKSITCNLCGLRSIARDLCAAYNVRVRVRLRRRPLSLQLASAPTLRAEVAEVAFDFAELLIL